MESKEIVRWQDAEAFRRFQMIAPLVADGVDAAQKVELRRKIAEEQDVSERTLRRYEMAYWAKSFEGLKPVSRIADEIKGPFPGFSKVLDEAIQLKREVPSRSVNQIIFILEAEKVVEPGKLTRPTLQRYLYKAGFGKKQMKKFSEAQNTSSKRFCKPHRMMLVQGDIKYVMKLPIGKNGAKVQCYIAALIDDHSRFILASGVYDHQDADIVEDVYRKAILKWGAFQSTYVDNGKQFVSTQLIRTLTRLGIRHLRAKPYAAASKGKIEVYNRLINSYIDECKAQKIRTLEEANIFWDLFVEEYYHDKAHEGIAEYYRSKGVEVPKEGVTPRQEFNRDSVSLRFLDAGVVGEAFLHHEERVVDKAGCISFKGMKYETSTSLIGATVEIAYDPMHPEELTVSYPGMQPFTAKPLQIGEYCSPKSEIPASMLPVEPESSRFLAALQRKRKAKTQHNADAISFAAYRKEAGSDV
jgi:transposase InsO family protein